MTPEQWASLIGQVAFPIVMVAWFAFRMETKLTEQTKMLQENAKAINRMAWLVFISMTSPDADGKAESLRRLRTELENQPGL